MKAILVRFNFVILLVLILCSVSVIGFSRHNDILIRGWFNYTNLTSAQFTSINISYNLNTSTLNSTEIATDELLVRQPPVECLVNTGMIYTNMTTSVCSNNITDWYRIGSNTVYMLGNVGIGTASPNQKLVVLGNTNMTGNLTVEGNINATGNITSGSGTVIIDGQNSAIFIGDISLINKGSILRVGSDLNLTTGILYLANNYDFGVPGSTILRRNDDSGAVFGVSNINSGTNAKAMYVLQSDAGYYGYELHSNAEIRDTAKVHHWTNESVAGEVWRLNSTVAGSYQFFDDNDDLILMMNGTTGNIGIGTTSPTYPLTVTSNVSGISIYATANISATDYITRTSVFDTSYNVWDYIKSADYYKDKDKIDHSKFYGYSKYNVTDYSRPIINVINETHNETTYPYEKTEEGVSLNKEIDLLRQAVYELKTELCRFENYAWC